MKTLNALLLGLLVWHAQPPAAPAYEANPDDPAIRCLNRNMPKQTSKQTVKFVTRDRLGVETVSRCKIIGKLYEDGRRRMVARFHEPDDIRGSALLVIEKQGRNDMFMYMPEFRKTRRITARAAGNSLFGTDFSFEDFERLQGLRNSSQTSRQEDAVFEGRPVYVLETRPGAAEESTYERIITQLDQETCVTLKTESYERGDRPRKILTTDREKLIQKNGLWIASSIVMRDQRDETETTLTIEEIEVDEPIPDKRFRQAELERHRN